MNSNELPFTHKMSKISSLSLSLSLPLWHFRILVKKNKGTQGFPRCCCCCLLCRTHWHISRFVHRHPVPCSCFIQWCEMPKSKHMKCARCIHKALASTCRSPHNIKFAHKRKHIIMNMDEYIVEHKHLFVWKGQKTLSRRLSPPPAISNGVWGRFTRFYFIVRWISSMIKWYTYTHTHIPHRIWGFEYWDTRRTTITTTIDTTKFSIFVSNIYSNFSIFTWKCCVSPHLLFDEQ